MSTEPRLVQLPLEVPGDDPHLASVARVFDGDQLRLAREWRGLTQVEVAGRVGVSKAAVNQFERGHNHPSVNTLAMLAQTLDVPPTFFLPDGRSASTQRDAFFRKTRSARAANIKRSIATAQIVRRLVFALEDYVQFPVERMPHYPLDGSASRPEVEAVASSVREDLGLPAGPVHRLLGHLERRGTVVARLPTDDVRIDAFSVPFEPWPVVVLGTDKSNTARTRFDAAHELGHLVMHALDEDRHVIEAQADWFAAAFLMPARDIFGDLPRRLDWTNLVFLKERWGVSLSALVRRAATLDAIDDTKYRAAMKTISAKGWRTSEPGQLPRLEPPRLLVAGAEAAIAAGGSLTDIAAHAAISVEDAQRLLGALRDTRPMVDI